MRMAEAYQCPDPYATTEMEEVAVARAAERMGLLDRLIIIRVSVNMDVFTLGVTPERLWGNAEAYTLASEESIPCLYAKLEIAVPQFLSYNLFRFNRRCLLDLMIG